MHCGAHSQTHKCTHTHTLMHETTTIIVINAILKLKHERGRQSILCVWGCACVHCSETLGNTSFLSLWSDVGRCQKHKHTSPGWALFFLAFLIRPMTLEAHVRQPLRSIFSPRVLIPVVRTDRLKIKRVNSSLSHTWEGREPAPWINSPGWVLSLHSV